METEPFLALERVLVRKVSGSLNKAHMITSTLPPGEATQGAASHSFPDSSYC